MNLEVISHEPAAGARPTPILFVHGAWHGAWCWDEFFLPYFAANGFNACALSLRGHGHSAGHDCIFWHRIRDYVDDVGHVAERFDTPPVVVGHSMGGFVVQKYLERYDAPAGVLLASVPSDGFLRPLLRWMMRDPIALLQSGLTLSGYAMVGTRRRAHVGFFSDDMPTEQVERYFRLIKAEAMMTMLDVVWRDLPQPERVESPLLVLGAANDRVFTVEEVQKTARAYGTQGEIFPNMAHDMMLEAGWQSVADRIMEWLLSRGL